jgi:signal transduction histidine kinase
MWVGMREMERLAMQRWPEFVAGGGVAGGLWLLGVRLRSRGERRRRQRKIEEELAAYARLDLRLPGTGGGLELAGRVTRLVAEKSPFRRVAMLIRDEQGKLMVGSSAGMDDATVEPLKGWGEGVLAGERGGSVRLGSVRRGDGGLGLRVGSKSFAVNLGRGPAAIGHSGAIVIPLWTVAGRMLGALAVGADGLMGVRRSTLAKALEPMEALAFKLEREMENGALEERLVRAEKLAGLGLMAGGMAHALNDPLTAVLGFADLIVATTGEVRVKADAEIIVREALRMRETVETLREFWRPRARREELVDVTGLMRELAAACAEKLESRGVRLVVEAGEEVAEVRGSRDRLRQMMEHLLNNAAQSLAGASAAGEGEEEQVIRIAVSVSGSVSGRGPGGRVHLVVSDTGPGFRQPGRVFEPGDSMGLGLSVCYGIVHEHDGEISAFNLHPHGAAVAVELPVAVADKKSEVAPGEKAYSASV